MKFQPACAADLQSIAGLTGKSRLKPAQKIVALCSVALSDEAGDKREAFKRKMLPMVGKVITVTGTLEAGNPENFIETDDGGVIYMASSSKLHDELRRLANKRITTKGELQFRRSGEFFMDAEKATIQLGAANN